MTPIEKLKKKFGNRVFTIREMRDVIGLKVLTKTIRSRKLTKFRGTGRDPMPKFQIKEE